MENQASIPTWSYGMSTNMDPTPEVKFSVPTHAEATEGLKGIILRVMRMGQQEMDRIFGSDDDVDPISSAIINLIGYAAGGRMGKLMDIMARLNKGDPKDADKPLRFIVNGFVFWIRSNEQDEQKADERASEAPHQEAAA